MVGRWEAGFGLALLGFELWGVRGGEGAACKESCCTGVKAAEDVRAERVVGEEAASCDGIASFRRRLLQPQGIQSLQLTTNADAIVCAATAHS